MLKDEEANMDLAKPHIPSEIQDFLKEIAFPQHEDEEDEASERTNPYQQMKANIKSAKPRVNTGSFKVNPCVSPSITCRTKVGVKNPVCQFA